MTSTKRPYLNPNLESSSDDESEQSNKKRKIEDDISDDYDDSMDDTYDENDMTTETEEDNQSDPDYVPEEGDVTDTEATKEAEDSVIIEDEKPKGANDETIPSKAETCEDKVTKTFSEKLVELKAKGISLQRASDSTLTLTKASESASTTTEDVNAANNNTPVDPKALAFVKSTINYPHDRNCIYRCQVMDGENLEMLSSISNASLCSPDFIKSCVSFVSCCIRLGDINLSRKVVSQVLKLSEVPGISPLSQALIGGMRSNISSIDEIEKWEVKGIESMRNRDFLQSAGYIAKSLKFASKCIRLLLAQGDAYLFANKLDECFRAVSLVLEREATNVAALFLKAYCLYHKRELDKSLQFFQQTLQQSADHTKAKTLISKVKLIKEKKEQAAKAANKNKLDDAINSYTQALEVDTNNKGLQTILLAERGFVYLKQKKVDLAQKDCDKALELDSKCFEALLLKAKCLFEKEVYGEVVSMLETMNTTDRHAQQKKKSEAESAARAKNLNEATKLYYEVVEIDRRNGRYRQLLRDCKQKHHLTSRLDYYALLQVEKTAGDSELRKAYFKKSREFHPDKHANASDEEKEKFSVKFKQAKEAYETLSDSEKRKTYDRGTVNPPPGGWYRDVDKRFLTTLKRISESNTIVMPPNLSKVGNIDIKSAGSTRGRTSFSTRGRGATSGPTPTFSAKGPNISMKTGPGITINRVPPTRGRGSRGRRK